MDKPSNSLTNAAAAAVPGQQGFDYLVVGAGFAGSVLAERLARVDGARVLVVDKRCHIGGNAHDHYDDNGVLVHPYGPHIFHSNSADIFEYLSAFTAWRPYQHRVLASADGQDLQMPINLSGGEVSYIFQPREGVLLRLELRVQTVDIEAVPRADGARAWIVDSRNIESTVPERRIQRLGWHVWRFFSVNDALRQANAAASDDFPAMLLLREDSRIARSAVSALRSRMPDRTRCLLMVGTGATELGGFESETRWERHIEPLSPGDLAWASLLALDASFATSAPLTISHTMHARRKVLVVDDDEINRTVASGLLEALGYEVATVNDGLDAIEYCKRLPPDVVLMDVNMPVHSGVDASRRMVELQRAERWRRSRSSLLPPTIRPKRRHAARRRA